MSIHPATCLLTDNYPLRMIVRNLCRICSHVRCAGDRSVAERPYVWALAMGSRSTSNNFHWSSETTATSSSTTLMAVSSSIAHGRLIEIGVAASFTILSGGVGDMGGAAASW